MRYSVWRFCTFLFFSLVCTSLLAETHRKVPSYEKYVSKYKDIAVKHQKKYGIPASITLAQGLLESGAGQSALAKKSNNHFGIKCHSDWKGQRAYHDDDLRGECFRKYKKVENSFEDHAKFLVERQRYKPLFDLKPNDYKGWARGLQKCGYATNPNYANLLIRIIEEYDLYKYDSKKGRKETEKIIFNHQVYKTNDLLYVHAESNETLDAIAKEFGLKASKLAGYNELPKDVLLKENSIVYLQKKQKKANKSHKTHIVKKGESMYFISQKYGIRLKNLYSMNKKENDYIPSEGDLLKLR